MPQTELPKLGLGKRSERRDVEASDMPSRGGTREGLAQLLVAVS